MTTKKQPSTDGDDEPFVLNKHKFPWHRELLSSELSPQAKVIGGWFAFHGLNSNGKLVTTHRRIVNETRIPYRTTQRAVAELVAHDFLMRDPQPGGENSYVFVPAFQRQQWLDEEALERQVEADEQEREERERQREAAEKWCRAEESWLRNELFLLAARGGAPDDKSAEWAAQVIDNARLKIETARNGCRQLEAHPARLVLDGLDAELAAGAAAAGAASGGVL